MTPELALSLAGFAFAVSVTPGPNNLMLMASGVNFGLRRSVPHMLGVSLGHALMVFLVGLGLAGLFLAEPRAVAALKVASVLYMLWLAWKIAQAAPARPGAAAGRPFTALQAAAFQWVNPKAWAAALTATSVYAPGQDAGAMAAVALVFIAVNLPSVGLWAGFGSLMAGILARPGVRLWFNRTMAVLLVASLWPVLRM